jgi:hypothetical protein
LFAVDERAVQTAKIANMHTRTVEVELTMLTRNELVAFGSGELYLALGRSAQRRNTAAAKAKTVSTMWPRKHGETDGSGHRNPPSIRVDFGNPVVDLQPCPAFYFQVASALSLPGQAHHAVIAEGR